MLALRCVFFFVLALVATVRRVVIQIRLVVRTAATAVVMFQRVTHTLAISSRHFQNLPL